MKKRALLTVVIGLIILLAVAGIVMAAHDKRLNRNREISEILEQNPVKVNWLTTYTNISINNRNYTKISFFLDKEGYVRIAELKTKEDELYIPARLGNYSVLYVGAQHFELPEVVKYIRKNQKSPMLGQFSWMEDVNKKYEKIVVENGIKVLFREAFQGVRTKRLELPESLEAQSSVTYDEAEIGKIVINREDLQGVIDREKDKMILREFDETNEKLGLNLPEG